MVWWKMRACVMVATVLATLTACASAVEPPPPTRGDVVLVSSVGKLATSTPVGAITVVPPTPIFDRGLLGNSIAPAEATDEPTETPTPLVRPTWTPAPIPTPYPTLEIPPRLPMQIHPPPTNTPGRPPPPPRPPPPRQPTPLPTATLVDPSERRGGNDDLARAAPIVLGRNVVGVLGGPTDVDVYSFEVADDEGIVVATLTGSEASAYRVVLITPGQHSSAAAPDRGGTTREVRAPIRSAVGRWYLEVSAVSRRPPRDSYTIWVEVKPAPVREDPADE